MSKAEDLAKKYCEGSSFEDACMEKPAYVAGYHQAEEDNELTWEDVRVIFLLVQVEWSPNKNEEEIYQEVLKRFKAHKEEGRV